MKIMGNKDEDETPINNKIKEKNGNKNAQQNNWGKFAKGCLSNIITIIIFALLGANFMYFSNLDDKMKNVYFPSNIAEYLSKSENYVNDKLKKISIPPSNGWPYTLNKGIKVDFSYEGMGNLLAQTVALTNANVRRILKTFLIFFSNGSPSIFSNKIVQFCVGNFMLLISLVSLPLLPILFYVTFFVFACVRAYTSGFLMLMLVLCGFCFGPSMWIGAGVSGMLFISYLLTFTLLPLYAEPLKIGLNVKKTSVFLSKLLGALCVSSAWKHLDDKIATGMTLVYFIVLISSLMTNNKKSV
jgi:hypothetical protein